MLFTFICLHFVGGQKNLSSLEPKAQVSFSDHNLSVVRRCRCRLWHCRKLFIFSSCSPEPISTKLGTKHSWVKGTQFCSSEGPGLFPRGGNYEIAKIHWRNFKKNLSLQIHWANFNQTWHKAFLGDEESSSFEWMVLPFFKGR